MKSARTKLLLAGLLGFLAVLGRGSPAQAQWDGFLVDLSNCVAIDAQIALDQDHWAHIVHYDRTHMALKYTRFDGDQWHGILIDRERDAGRGCDMVVGPGYKGHISYRRNGDLMYIKTEGRTYSAPERILEDSLFGTTSLALDGGGNPHIALFTDQGLTYVRRAGGQWVVERPGGAGSRPSLALGPDGSPHISWIGQDSGQGWGRLYYSHRQDGVWVHQALDPETHVSGDTAIVVDGTGRVRIAYLDWLDNLVKMALGDGTGWSFETLAVNADRTRGLDLALDAEDRPHLVYTATGPISEAKYGFLDDDLGWVFEVIAPGAGPSLDIDVYGRPHVALSQTGEKLVPQPWPIDDCEVLYYSFRR